MSTFDDLVPTLRTIARLKTTARRGWRHIGIDGAESVADHTYGTSILALLLAPPGTLDRDRCLRMAVVHDLAESLVGDVIPADEMTAEAKLASETEAIATVAREARWPEVAELFEEYADGTTPEARWVRDANLIDMVVQALEYESIRAAPASALETFWASAREGVATDTGRAVLAALERARAVTDQ